jgi:peptide/nickel transport system substrate-binding protein
LAACGDDDDDAEAPPAATPAPGEPDATPTPEAVAETPAAGTEPEPGVVTEGPAELVNAEGDPTDTPTGELRIALAFDATSLDPIDTYSLNNGRWQQNVFSPLVWRDTNLVVYDGEGDNPAPSEGFGLAESWEYLDDLTLEMRLRTDVTFHNGEAFDAEAVRSTFERLLDPDNQSPQRFNYTAIESVEVMDDSTVQFHFNSVDPVMITKLAGYGAFITPPGATEDDEAFSTEQAIGTGPFQIVEYVRDDRLVLEAWDDYWAGRPSRVQTLRYRIIPDDNTRLSEFLAGSIDVLTLNVSQAEAAEGVPNLSVVDIGVPTFSGLRLDASQSPTDQKEVRQAIAHAIDLQLIVDTILGGFARPVGIWQSPFSFGFDDIPPYDYDPDRAQQYLEDSGLQTPVEITYDIIGGDTQQREIAAAVKGMLDAVGFDVQIRSQERATFFDDYRAGNLGNIVPFGWGGWTLDFDNTYYSMHYTDESYNPSYSNPEVDELLDEQRNTLDQERREEIAMQLNEILHEDAIDVMMYQQTYLWGVNDRVRNFSIPPDERLWWYDAWITE